MWHFLEHIAPYHVPETYMNRFINKKLRRPRISHEIAVFTKRPCLEPPSGGRVHASTPILQSPVEGHKNMDSTGWFVRHVQVYVAMERQTLKKPQKFDKFPPRPLNNPYPYLNLCVIFCSHSTRL